MCTALYMMVLYDRARVGPTTKTSDEISIICLFRLILQAKSFVLFCFVVFELLRSQMLIPYLPQMVFSYSYVNTNPSRSSSFSFQFFFNRRVSLQVDPIISTTARSITSSSQRGSFQPFQIVFVFSTLPPFVFSKDSDLLMEYPSYWCEVSPFFFVNILTRWFSRRCSTSSSFSILSFSDGSNSSFQCWSYHFPRFKCYPMPVHLIIVHLSLFVSGVLKIYQKNHVSILNPFKLLRDFSLIQALILLV